MNANLNLTGGLHRLQNVREAAAAVAATEQYAAFVSTIRHKFPWRFEMPPGVLDRDYLRVVEHHLAHLIPLVQPYIEPHVRRVLDFGCGSGGSAIALALACPEIQCYGTDVDGREIEVARERAALYGVADRCHFEHVSASEILPVADCSADLSLCSSVLEYVTEKQARRFCIQEMLRIVRPNGLLFFSVPNRLYPLEVHSSKWGWNYFPEWLNATTVDSTFWEVRKFARPTVVELYRTPLLRLFRPWSNFCIRKITDSRRL